MAIGFGQALRARRRAAGLSQRRLAEVVGVDFTYISKVENDRLPPPAADTLARIAAAIGVPAEDLLAAAGKVPKTVGASLAGSVEAQQFLQMAADMRLSESEWGRMVGELKDLRDRSGDDGDSK